MSYKIIPHVAGLDGLRGLAIIAITCFHIVPEYVPGGYLGVLLFFIISGFLLAYNSFYKWQIGNFALRKYYINRARRIYPELIIMLLTSIGVIYWVNPQAVAAIRPEVISVLLGYNNWWQICQNANYFTRIMEASPFAHLWYLGVEIQYYIIWPLLLWITAICTKLFGKMWAVFTLGYIAVISSFMMPLMWFLHCDITRLYYGTDTRIFALLWGAVMGLASVNLDLDDNTLQNSNKMIKVIKYIVATCLLTIISVMFFTIAGNNELQYQGGMLIVVAIFMLIVVLSKDENLIVGNFVDNKVLSWLGKHSYGIFLWQYPVIYIVEQYDYIRGVERYVIICALIIILTIWGEKLGKLILGLNKGNISWRMVKVAILSCITLVGMFFMGSGCYGIAISASQRAVIQQDVVEQLKAEEEMLSETKEDNAESKSQKKEPEIVKQEISLDGIVCIGDSVMLGAASQLRNVFPNCIIDAKVSRYVGDGIDIVKSLQSQKKIGKIVVIALGTNGPISGWERYESQTMKLLDVLGSDTHVYWVNTHAPHLEWQNTNNEFLEKIRKQRTNVIVVDWHKEAALHREWLASDAVHPTREGTIQYARIIKETIEKSER